MRFISIYFSVRSINLFPSVALRAAKVLSQPYFADIVAKTKLT